MLDLGGGQVTQRGDPDAPEGDDDGVAPTAADVDQDHGAAPCGRKEVVEARRLQEVLEAGGPPYLFHQLVPFAGQCHTALVRPLGPPRGLVR
ncbi:hypothetical protein [Streptomyces sp. NPDC090131]|uniref:hypothetical protein n=1 Tax=Streptomyces sp. NPDC090131 TaxID=3365954 RepID=UPI003824C457